MNQLATALNNAGVTTSTFAYFDLIEYLDGIHSPRLAEGTTSYMAWSIDSMVINACRALFRECYKGYLASDRAPTIDAYNSFLALMAEAEEDGRHLQEIGLEDTTSYSQIVQLMNTRKHWHDIAAQKASGTYEPRSLSAIIIEEKQQEVSALTVEKLTVDAKFLCRKNPERVDAIVKDMIDRENTVMADMYKNRVRTNSTILTLLSYMTTKSSLYYDGEAPAFHTLPSETRKRLVISAIRSIDVVCSRLARNSRVTTFEYQEARIEGAEVIEHLERVLKSPHYDISRDE